MTTSDALDAASEAEPGERLRLYETICGPRGACRRGPLANDPGRWTWCPGRLTVYDDYGSSTFNVGIAMTGEPKKAAFFAKARGERQVRT